MHAFTGLHNGTVCHFSGSYILDIAPAYSLYEEDNKKFSVYQLPTSTGHVTTPLKLSTVDGKCLCVIHSQLRTSVGQLSCTHSLSCKKNLAWAIWVARLYIRTTIQKNILSGCCLTTLALLCTQSHLTLSLCSTQFSIDFMQLDCILHVIVHQLTESPFNSYISRCAQQLLHL